MTAALPSGRRPYLPAGLRYDGKTQDWQLDANGQFRGVHWIDEGMALSVLVDAGSIKCSPNTGNRIREKLQYLGTQADAAIVESLIMVAQPLARYVEQGWVTVTRVQSEMVGSRLAYAVYYRNELEKNTRFDPEKKLLWYT